MAVTTKYDSYTVTLTGSQVTTIAADQTKVAITDTPTIPASNTNVLGDIGSDQFTTNPSGGTFTFVETVTWAGGTGFIATVGGVSKLFVVSTQVLGVIGTLPPAVGTPLILVPSPGIQSNGEWIINSNISLGIVAGIGCFYAGTLIATPDGERAVETLAAGDLVLTASGAAKPIVWLGRSVISSRFADPARVAPIRIKAGALGENLPTRDLLVSPGHAILLDGVLVHAGAMVNGASIVRETDMPVVFTYYHVDLATHEIVLAEGAPAESFIDGVEEMDFQNWAERPATAAATVEELAYPRAKSARQLPRATREMLAARAEAIAPALAAAA